MRGRVLLQSIALRPHRGLDVGQVRMLNAPDAGEAHGTMSRQAQRMWIWRMWKRCRPIENGVHVSDVLPKRLRACRACMGA